MLAERYFDTARERYHILLQRRNGLSREYWSDNPIFRRWRFCNVHREDDRTTTWFREDVRDPLSRSGDLDRLLVATVAFRWFNRVEVGEKIKHLLLDGWSSDAAYEVLRGTEPVVTGAYMIKTPTGRDKLSGVLDCIDVAIPMLREFLGGGFDEPSLRSAWGYLCRVPFMGGFLAYEVVSDLRWTPLLENAPDVMGWANAGPGCARGLGRVRAGRADYFSMGARGQAEMLDLMRGLLLMSREERYWPQAWRAWEMREVEHWACEFDKYERAAAGERLKRRYQ